MGSLVSAPLDDAIASDMNSRWVSLRFPKMSAYSCSLGSHLAVYFSSLLGFFFFLFFSLSSLVLLSRGSHKYLLLKEMGKQKKTGSQGNNNQSTAADRGGDGKHQSGRERKITLQHDVDKLRKKLRHEENVHRALERAFTRPLGALPRLPPYLPSHTLELLAEVAVLEEEVVRLEEQVVNFRQGLYQEAIYLNSSRKTKENGSEQLQSFHNLISSEASGTTMRRWSLQSDQNDISSSNFSTIGKKSGKKLNSFLTFPEDTRGKENQLNSNFSGILKQSSVKKVSSTQMSAQEFKKTHAQEDTFYPNKGDEMNALDEAALEESSVPNKLSEDILRCLINIFVRMNSLSSEEDSGTSPSVSGSSENSEDMDVRDPYGICAEFGKRNIGPYKYFRAVEVSSSSGNLLPSSFLGRRLKMLLRKLESVDLAKLTHQQKLAFWINIYNSCMMNAFLEQGVPGSPEMIVALMPKAMINVGGHLLSAMSIEHFILRLPYYAKHAPPGGTKKDEMAMRGTYGLEFPEPLVTFALSCGSWSSPAVRVYTAFQVEKELEIAKRDYLQAAVGVLMPNKLAIPKLLDWYLLDFAKDIESLMDWVCLQLPSDLRTEAVKCLEMGRSSLIPQPIQVLPYEFRFRYLLAL